MSEPLLDSPTRCPAGCAAPLVDAYAVAGHPVRRCVDCGLYQLVAVPQSTVDGQLDRSKFDDAFRELRQSGYARILDAAAKLRPIVGARVLDVGCSSGWFLEAARQRGARGFGIEPDRFFFDRARRALPEDVALVHGLFPADLPASWPRFDWITFHDVFEHLPDPRGVLAACADRLAAGGLLVLSIPSSDGFAFRLSELLRRVGLAGPLERAFQVHYPFPHLWYLNRRSVEALGRSAGFATVGQLSLRGFRLRGSLRRAQMDRTDPGARGLGVYANAAALAGFALLQPLVQADNIVAILRRDGE